MHTFDRIYIHCSYSIYGDFETINNWHKDRNFPTVFCPIRKRDINIGYHFLITNPFKTKKQADKGKIESISDGKVVIARPITERGAHVRGENYRSVGICFIGTHPTPAQWSALVNLSARLVKKYGISIDKVLGHHEYYLRTDKPMIKTCPSFCMDTLREAIQHNLTI